MPEVQEVFRMSTQKVKPDPGALERQLTRQRRRSTGKKVGAFAIAATICVAAVALILGTRGGENRRTPADEPSTVNPVDPAAEEVATGFVEAYGAFEVEHAITYLADDANTSPLITSVGAEGVEKGTPDGLRQHISLLEAMGYEQMLDPCEETVSSTSGTVVRCAFDFHLIRSDEIGRGPFSGSYLDLTVRDGEIVQASVFWEVEKFSPQVWEPFARWVSTHYPEDAAVMYEDETYSAARLTEESIRLWERHSRGYVNEIAAE
jgi:hypothetical protein